MSGCNICANKYNKKLRCKITCSSCDHECCSVCFETYLSTSKLQPQCMQCHRPWDFQCLKENLSTASIKRITDTKKLLLLQEQKCLIPHTIEYVNLNNEEDKCDEEVKDVQKKIKSLYAQIYEIEHRRCFIRRQKNIIKTNFLTYRNTSSSSVLVKKNEEEIVYIRPCNKDECKGYITNKGVCGICKTKYCKKCLVEFCEDHECDPNDVLSVEMIKKDSKSCPNCTTLIHRISGCPDMFCVSCHTAFNWNNLKVDTNGNSNPLYYKWIRDGTNTDILYVTGNCENLHIMSVFRSNNFKNIKDNNIKIDLDKILNSLDHTRRNIHTFYQSISGNLDSNFETLTLESRAKYMENKITEKHFMTRLMRIHKANEYNNNITQSKNLLNGYLNDMKRNIVYSENFDVKVCIQEYVNFATYMNECVSHLRNVFYTKTTLKQLPTESVSVSFNHSSTTNFITIPKEVLTRIL